MIGQKSTSAFARLSMIVFCRLESQMASDFFWTKIFSQTSDHCTPLNSALYLIGTAYRLRTVYIQAPFYADSTLQSASRMELNALN